MNLNKVYNFPIFTNSPFTPVYGLARSVLALGSLITLAFTNIYFYIDKQMLEKAALNNNSLTRFSLFRVIDFDDQYLVQFLAILILLAVISGYFPKITGILHWWVSWSFNSSAILVDGGDQLAAVLTFLLVPVTLLDNRSNHWSKTKFNSTANTNLVANVFLLMICLQMSVVYLQAAVEKIYKINEWVSGTAIYYFMNDPLFGAPSWMLPIISPLLNSKFVFFICWSVIILEFFLAAALVMDRQKKKILFYVAVLFHFLIIVNMGLFSFFCSMLGGLVIYLIPRDMNIKETISTYRGLIVRSKSNYLPY